MSGNTSTATSGISTMMSAPSIWKYFDKVTDNKGAKKGKCKRCSKLLSNAGGDTTGMHTHLGTHKDVNKQF